MAASLSIIYGAGDYMRRALDPKYGETLLREHLEIINTAISGTSDNFQLPKNKKKNRNLDYPCWDISRVVLKSHCKSDYINANYVSGFDLNYKFITTQQPTANTFDDFWSMCWQENSRVIVMLNGTKKQEHTSLQYYSYNKEHTVLKEFVITEVCIAVETQYTLTTLTVVRKQTGESRTIHHFKYLDWSETGFPELQLFLGFFLAVNRQNHHDFVKALQTSQPVPGPIVVHCDIGIGRTAAYCAIDICLYQLVHTGSVSVASKVLTVRRQRNFSIQMPNYYIFINNVLLYFLVTIRMNISMFFELRSHLTGKDLHLLSLDYKASM